MTVSNQKSKISIGIFFLLFVLYFLYVNFTVPVFASMGFTSFFSFKNLVIGSTFFCLGLFILTFIKINEFIYSFLVLITIFLIIPSTITYINSLTNISILLSHYFLFFSVLLIGNYLKISFKDLNIKKYKKKEYLLIISVLLILPYLYYFLPHINLKNLLLQDIYETRAIQKEINNMYLGYSYSILSKIVIPMLIVYSMYVKNIKSIFLGLFLLLFLFLCGAHKSVMVGTVFIVLFYYGTYYNKIYMLIIVLLIALLSSYFIYLINNDFVLPASIIVRRSFFVPSLLDHHYFEFFKDKPLFWSGSIGRHFIEYPYDKNVAYVIGKTYFNSDVMAANNGIISSGYSNAGWYGVVINSTIISFFLVIIKSLNISNKFFGIYFFFMITMVSSALPILLLTHGGFALIFLAYIFQQNTKNFD